MPGMPGQNHRRKRPDLMSERFKREDGGAIADRTTNDVTGDDDNRSGSGIFWHDDGPEPDAPLIPFLRHSCQPFFISAWKGREADGENRRRLILALRDKRQFFRKVIQTGAKMNESCRQTASFRDFFDNSSDILPKTDRLGGSI